MAPSLAALALVLGGGLLVAAVPLAGAAAGGGAARTGTTPDAPPAVAAAALMGRAAAVSAQPPSDWEWPVRPARVLRVFQPPTSRFGPGHRGVDLAAADGQPVVAAADGTVVFAGRVAGRGVLVIGHQALRISYEPVAAWVPAGSAVAPGQPVAVLAPSTAHCGAVGCLHWGVRIGDTYLDPLALLRAPPPVLLPLPEARSGSGPAPVTAR